MKTLILIATLLVAGSSLASEDDPMGYENQSPANSKSRLISDPLPRYREGSFDQPFRDYHHDYGGPDRVKRDKDWTDGHRDRASGKRN